MNRNDYKNGNTVIGFRINHQWKHLLRGFKCPSFNSNRGKRAVFNSHTTIFMAHGHNLKPTQPPVGIKSPHRLTLHKQHPPIYSSQTTLCSCSKASVITNRVISCQQVRQEWEDSAWLQGSLSEEAVGLMCSIWLMPSLSKSDGWSSVRPGLTARIYHRHGVGWGFSLASSYLTPSGVLSALWRRPLCRCLVLIRRRWVTLSHRDHVLCFCRWRAGEPA